THRRPPPQGAKRAAANTHSDRVRCAAHRPSSVTASWIDWCHSRSATARVNGDVPRTPRLRRGLKTPPLAFPFCNVRARPPIPACGTFASRPMKINMNPFLNRRRAALAAGVLALVGIIAGVYGAQSASGTSALTLKRDEHPVTRGQLE